MRRTAGVLVAYLALAVVFTWPLGAGMSTQTPGGEAWTYDGFSMVWNLWWFQRAVLWLNGSPFVTDRLFAPLGASLYLHTNTLWQSLSALPLLAWVTPVTAGNLLLIASLALCGYGAYLLALDQFRGAGPHARAGAFVAGAVYAFTTQRFMFLVLGHHNFFATQFVPFYLLYVLRASRPALRTCAFVRNVALAGIFLSLCLLTELSLAVMGVLVAGLYWLFASLGQMRAGAGPAPTSDDSVWRRGAAAIAASALLMALLTAPYLLPTLRESFDPKYIPQYWGGAPVTSVDIAGMFVPSTLHPLFGTHDWPREWQQALTNAARFGSVNTFYAGYGVLALVLVGLLGYRRARLWGWLALALVILSWGPIAHFNGVTTFNLDGMPVTVGLPYIILHYIPVLNGLRVPQRFGLVAILALAIPAGYGVLWLWQRIRPSCAASVAGIVLIVVFATFEHALMPLPLSDARVPSIYDRIAAEPGDFTVMDIPLGWRSGYGPQGTENTQLQYYQTVHGKRLIGGFVARTPSFLFDYFLRHPILDAIAVQESEGRLPKVEGVRDRALAADLAYFYDLRYIIVHPPASAPTPYDATRQRVLDYVREMFDIDLVEERDGLIVYRVNQPAPRTSLRIDFGTVASSLNRGEGWGADETIGGASANWLIGTEGRVFVPLRTLGDYMLTVRATPFAYAGRPPQTLTVRVNGDVVGAPITLADGWNEYSVLIPARALMSGLNGIVVTAAASAAPSEVLAGNTDTRRLSVAVDWVRADGK